MDPTCVNCIHIGGMAVIVLLLVACVATVVVLSAIVRSMDFRARQNEVAQEQQAWNEQPYWCQPSRPVRQPKAQPGIVSVAVRDHVRDVPMLPVSAGKAQGKVNSTYRVDWRGRVIGVENVKRH